LAIVSSAYSDISYQRSTFQFSKSSAIRSIKYGFNSISSDISIYHRPNKNSIYKSSNSQRILYNSQSKLQAVVSWPRIDLVQKSKFNRVKLAEYSRRFLVIAAGLFLGIKAKFGSKLKNAADAMESGWKQRGVGGSFARTIEVWVFAVAFAFKYVRLYHFYRS